MMRYGQHNNLASQKAVFPKCGIQNKKRTTMDGKSVVETFPTHVVRRNSRKKEPALGDKSEYSRYKISPNFFFLPRVILSTENYI